VNERERILALLHSEPVLEAARSAVMGLGCWKVDGMGMTNVVAAGEIARAAIAAIAAKLEVPCRYHPIPLAAAAPSPSSSRRG
jgi:hypothetical protein